MDLPTEKCCSICQQIKPMTEFSKDASHSDGYRSSCESCRRARLVEIRETFPPNATCAYGPHPYYLPPALQSRRPEYCSVAHRSADLRELNSTITEKACKECGKTKPLGCFFRQALGVGGRRAICAECTSTKRKTLRRQRGLKSPICANLSIDPHTGRFVPVKSFEERFWEKVQICEHGRDCRNCCWPWIARRSPEGYGQFGWREPDEDTTRTKSAHVVAYRITFGQWPKPVGRHTCDTPECCQPWHVIPGTHQQNSDDMKERGRSTAKPKIDIEKRHGITTGHAFMNINIRTWTDFPTGIHQSMLKNPCPERTNALLHYCEVCGRAHIVRAYRIAKGFGRFCSTICANFAKTTPMIERFWASVEKGAGDLACWLWKGSIHQDTGYGVITVVMKTGVSKHFLAHRLAFEFEHGPLPDGQLVLHTCDIRACIRNDGEHSHLFSGTQAMNMADATRKGRRASGIRHWSQTKPEGIARGERSGMAKLTEAQVWKIHRLRGTKPAHLIAKEFHISETHLYRIWRYDVWAHLKPLMDA